MRHPIFAVALTALAALTLWGCNSGGSGSGGGGGFSSRKGADQGKILRYPIPNNPTTMDPHLVQDGDTIDVLQQMYEGLVGWGENNEPVGYLAEKWEVSDDGKTYTFTLRANAKFHNGRAVTADDVVWSLNRSTNPKIQSPVSEAYLDDIVGVNERVQGKADSVSGVKKVSENQVAVTLKKPTPYFLGKFTYLVAAVLPKESVPEDKVITTKEQMVGTGPFKINEFLSEQQVKMDAFADYWGGAPKLEGILRLVIGDAQTRLNKFKNGEVDLVNVERQDIDGIKKDADLKDKLNYYDRPAIWYLGFNQLQYEPFKNREVRRAFAMAIDRDKIVNELLGGVNKKADGILPPGVPGQRDNAAVLPFDVALAKETLKKAGFEGSKMPALELTFRDERPDIRIVAESIASQLNANLGVNVKLQAMEWGAYLTKLNNKEQTFFHMRWAADYLDPQNFLSHMLATWGPENKLGYSSSEFDALCKEADSTLDMEKRKPLYAKAEDTVLQDAIWMPIYFQRDAELHNTKLTGIRESLFGHLPHATTDFTP